MGGVGDKSKILNGALSWDSWLLRPCKGKKIMLLKYICDDLIEKSVDGISTQNYSLFFQFFTEMVKICKSELDIFKTKGFWK